MPRIATLTLPADEMLLPDVIEYLNGLLAASVMSHAEPVQINTSESYVVRDPASPHKELTVRQELPPEPAFDPAKPLTDDDLPTPSDDLMDLAEAVGLARKAV